tara:strand:+ start:5975 stop:6397 length:423 start_codon:yes stop_codon:yes gene_type:complete
MKKIKTLLIITLIFDLLQFIPLILIKISDDFKGEMIGDFKIEGLMSSQPALEVLDIMFSVIGFISLGIVLSVIYTMRLKHIEALKAACFILFIVHLFWTLPDFITLISGGSTHPPIPVMIISLIPVLSLLYASKYGQTNT